MTKRQQGVSYGAKSTLAKVAGGGAVAVCLALIASAVPTEIFAAASPWNEVAPPQGATPGSRFYPAGYRTDVVDIPIPGNDGDLEYKIKMKEGDTVVYSWEVRGITNPELFYSEFHGHTEPPPGQKGDVTFYRKSTGLNEHGTLISPFQGIHGWYLQNQSTDPVTVRLRLAGFYEIVPGQKATPVRE